MLLVDTSLGSVLPPPVKLSSEDPLCQFLRRLVRYLECSVVRFMESVAPGSIICAEHIAFNAHRNANQFLE